MGNTHYKNTNNQNCESDEKPRDKKNTKTASGRERAKQETAGVWDGVGHGVREVQRV